MTRAAKGQRTGVTVTSPQVCAVEAELNRMETEAAPCLSDPVCTCSTCERYMALWGELERLEEQKDREANR